MSGGDYQPSAEIAPYFDVIGHRYKPAHHERVRGFFKTFLRKMTPHLRCRGLDRLAQHRESFPEGEKPIYMHIGRHLSELDWIGGQYLLSGHGMPVIAAMGDNLCVGKIGDFLRAMGAFVAVRDETKIDGTAISKQISKSLMASYMRHLILNEERDVLIYPEFARIESDGKTRTKYGRSYSGELLDFTPIVFRVVKGIGRDSKRPLMVVPHNASWERVVEDQIFTGLAEMKKKGRSNTRIYLNDLGFILTHWLYQNGGDAEFSFGEPIPVQDYSAKELAEKTRKEVAKLQTIFPTHAFAYAVGDDESVDVEDLELRIDRANARFAWLGVKVQCMNPWESLERAYEQFHQSVLGIVSTRRIVTAKNGVITVERPDVLHQYRDNARSIEKILSEN